MLEVRPQRAPSAGAAPEKHDRNAVLYVQVESLAPARGALQLSVQKSVAALYAWARHGARVRARRVGRSDDKHTVSDLDFLELAYKEEYISRSENWRIIAALHGQCVFKGKAVEKERMRVKPTMMLRNQERVASGRVTSRTKILFRSKTARLFWLIQVSSEMWDFADDGEQYFEKVLIFVKILLDRWRSAGVKHALSIILFGRVFYELDSASQCQWGSPASGSDLADDAKADDAKGSVRVSRVLQEDELGRLYRDHFRVVHEANMDGAESAIREAMRDIREALMQTPRAMGWGVSDPATGLVGAPSTSADGNLVEALNLVLTDFERHYYNRNLKRTGQNIMLLTAGTGRFFVNKRLTQLTNVRMDDNGIIVDIVSVARPPLYLCVLFLVRPPKNRSASVADDERLPPTGLRKKRSSASSLARLALGEAGGFSAAKFSGHQQHTPPLQRRLLSRAATQVSAQSLGSDDVGTKLLLGGSPQVHGSPRIPGSPHNWSTSTLSTVLARLGGSVDKNISGCFVPRWASISFYDYAMHVSGGFFCNPYHGDSATVPTRDSRSGAATAPAASTALQPPSSAGAAAATAAATTTAPAASGSILRDRVIANRFRPIPWSRVQSLRAATKTGGGLPLHLAPPPLPETHAVRDMLVHDSKIFAAPAPPVQAAPVPTSAMARFPGPSEGNEKFGDLGTGGVLLVPPSPSINPVRSGSSPPTVDSVSVRSGTGAGSLPRPVPRMSTVSIAVSTSVRGSWAQLSRGDSSSSDISGFGDQSNQVTLVRALRHCRGAGSKKRMGSAPHLDAAPVDLGSVKIYTIQGSSTAVGSGAKLIINGPPTVDRRLHARRRGRCGSADTKKSPNLRKSAKRTSAAAARLRMARAAAAAAREKTSGGSVATRGKAQKKDGGPSSAVSASLPATPELGPATKGSSTIRIEMPKGGIARRRRGRDRRSSAASTTPTRGSVPGSMSGTSGSRSRSRSQGRSRLLRESSLSASPNLPVPLFGRHKNPQKEIQTMARSAKAQLRWGHLYLPAIPDLYSSVPNWRSLIVPGTMPLTTDYFPSKKDLQSCMEYSYSASLIPGMNPYEDNTLELLAELMCQRFNQEYQLVSTGVLPPLDKKRVLCNSLGRDSLGQDGQLQFKFSFRSEYQILTYHEEKDSITVQRFVPRSERSTRRRARAERIEIPYTYNAWSAHLETYVLRSTTIKAHHDEYDWNYTDQLMSGYQTEFQSHSKAKEICVMLLPADAPGDFAGWIKSVIGMSVEELGINVQAEDSGKTRRGLAGARVRRLRVQLPFPRPGDVARQGDEKRPLSPRRQWAVCEYDSEYTPGNVFTLNLSWLVMAARTVADWLASAKRRAQRIGLRLVHVPVEFQAPNTRVMSPFHSPVEARVSGPHARGSIGRDAVEEALRKSFGFVPSPGGRFFLHKSGMARVSVLPSGSITWSDNYLLWASPLRRESVDLFRKVREHLEARVTRV